MVREEGGVFDVTLLWFSKRVRVSFLVFLIGKRCSSPAIMHRRLLPSRLAFGKPVIDSATLTSTVNSKNNSSSNGIPSQARVVVCGGGAIGVSVAYQLTEAGWKDVVVLEQNTQVLRKTLNSFTNRVSFFRILGGSTVLSAGIMRRLAPSFLATRILDYTNDCFQSLIAKGYDIGKTEKQKYTY